MIFSSKRVAAAIVGVSMVVSPVAASAATTNPAASLSVSRAAAPGGGQSKLGANVPTTTVISIGVLAALIAIVLVATDNNDKSDSK